MHTGVDCGGTFTDVVAADGTFAKVPSDPEDPATAVRAALEAVEHVHPASLAHGTTVATNAVLERRGAIVGLVTTEGFADVIEIARQTRPSLYDHFADRPEPLVAAEHRFEVRERLDAQGEVVTPLDADLVAAVPELPDDVEAVAVALLHSDRERAHEDAVADELRRRGHDVSASVQVAPEFREYERTSTTVVNAYVRPVCGEYLGRLAELADEVNVMSSAGGLVGVDEASAFPARLLLSGPAGGVRAASVYAKACGYDHAVSFDMGGTSTDVCLIRGGVPEPAAQREVEGFPIRLPSLDIHTIGAGGGSIATIDPGGALVVGPRSAGARPGPACYGHGGVDPTVTDADLVAGRIPGGSSFGGLVLDAAAAAVALERAGVDAAGVLAVVDANMERAVRTVTVARGVDPRGCALVAFGGAGPLHAVSLAESLGMTAVVVPPRAGVLSAVGLLCAPRQGDVVRSWSEPDDHDGARMMAPLLVDIAAEGLWPDVDVVEDVAERIVGFDCRYAGQSHELTVADPDDFGRVHALVNGFERPGTPVEVLAIRATARAYVEVDPSELPTPPEREGFATVRGPRAIAESDCSIWVPEGWEAVAGPAGCIVVRRLGDDVGSAR